MPHGKVSRVGNPGSPAKFGKGQGKGQGKGKGKGHSGGQHNAPSKLRTRGPLGSFNSGSGDFKKEPKQPSKGNPNNGVCTTHNSGSRSSGNGRKVAPKKVAPTKKQLAKQPAKQVVSARSLLFSSMAAAFSKALKFSALLFVASSVGKTSADTFNVGSCSVDTDYLRDVSEQDLNTHKTCFEALLDDPDNTAFKDEFQGFCDSTFYRDAGDHHDAFAGQYWPNDDGSPGFGQAVGNAGCLVHPDLATGFIPHADGVQMGHDNKLGSNATLLDPYIHTQKQLVTLILETIEKEIADRATTVAPSGTPSAASTVEPSAASTGSTQPPSESPTGSTQTPSGTPTGSTGAPSVSTGIPSAASTDVPTPIPSTPDGSEVPTGEPTPPSTESPSVSTQTPSESPTGSTGAPSVSTQTPSESPTGSTGAPSVSTQSPSGTPTGSTGEPTPPSTGIPSVAPSTPDGSEANDDDEVPINDTPSPSGTPTGSTGAPSVSTQTPSGSPSESTGIPSVAPSTPDGSEVPTGEPTPPSTGSPSGTPSAASTGSPSESPSVSTGEPTPPSTGIPSVAPSTPGDVCDTLDAQQELLDNQKAECDGSVASTETPSAVPTAVSTESPSVVSQTTTESPSTASDDEDPVNTNTPSGSPTGSPSVSTQTPSESPSESPSVSTESPTPPSTGAPSVSTQPPSAVPTTTGGSGDDEIPEEVPSGEPTSPPTSSPTVLCQDQVNRLTSQLQEITGNKPIAQAMGEYNGFCDSSLPAALNGVGVTLCDSETDKRGLDAVKEAVNGLIAQNTTKQFIDICKQLSSDVTWETLSTQLSTQNIDIPQDTTLQSFSEQCCELRDIFATSGISTQETRAFSDLVSSYENVMAHIAAHPSTVCPPQDNDSTAGAGGGAGAGATAAIILGILLLASLIFIIPKCLKNDEDGFQSGDTGAVSGSRRKRKNNKVGQNPATPDLEKGLGLHNKADIRGLFQVSGDGEASVDATLPQTPISLGADGARSETTSSRSLLSTPPPPPPPGAAIGSGSHASGSGDHGVLTFSDASLMGHDAHTDADDGVGAGGGRGPLSPDDLSSSNSRDGSRSAGSEHSNASSYMSIGALESEEAASRLSSAKGVIPSAASSIASVSAHGEPASSDGAAEINSEV